MTPDSSLAAIRLFNMLVKGREADRVAAQAALGDLSQADRARLRVLIRDALSRDFYPGKEAEEEDPSIASTRCWLISTLGWISDGDAEAEQVVKKHTDPCFEPYPWARDWALEGLVVAAISDLKDLARKIAGGEKEPLVRMLAVAILASKGDSASSKEILEGLEEIKHGEGLPEVKQSVWRKIFRALRIVYIPKTVPRRCEIIEASEDYDVIYQAIMALGRVPSTSPHAEHATRTLENFIAKVRQWRWADGIRTKALRALGNLKIERVGPLLIEDLTDGNPAIVYEAAQALQKVMGIRTATARVGEAATKAGGDRITGFANALRWMDRDAVVEELEAAMVSGPADQQETARLLLSEIGGAAAFEKLRARTTAAQHATAMLEKAEEKIRDLFETTIQEARRGFKWSIFMDMIVFSIGVVLIITRPC